MTGRPARPPQTYARGGRRALDRLWLDYLEHGGHCEGDAFVRRSPGFVRGVGEFNQGRYFQCHETWEDAWREAPYPASLFLLGLTKIAVGLVHAGRGNASGAARLLGDGLRFLSPFPDGYGGVDVERLRAGVRGLLTQDGVLVRREEMPRVEWHQGR